MIRLPEQNTDNFIRTFIRDAKPTHLISLERPGKAENGHYHSMRGEQLDDMITDSALFLSAAREAGATVISIGDGGNEMGMGTFRREILAGVPHGELICTAEAADLTLASGVSNWWGWGIASLLSLELGRNLLPSDLTETELLRRVVAAGGVDGCTKKAELLSAFNDAGIQIRSYADEGFRITVGTETENELVLNVLKTFRRNA